MRKLQVPVCSMLVLLVMTIQTNFISKQTKKQSTASFVEFHSTSFTSDCQDADFEFLSTFMAAEASMLPPLNLYFMKGDSKIRPSLQLATYMSDLADYVSSHPDKKIFLTGYADPTETSVDPLQLSKKRAQSVKDYIIRRGLSGTNIIVSGKGAQQLMSFKEKARGKEKNRRVEVRIY